MKPSERRALREMEAQKEKEEILEESEFEPADAPENTDKPLKKNKKGKTILDDDVESMRKEGFFQSHVKLVTFIICMVVFLGAVTVIPLVHWLNTREIVKGEIPMELEDIIAISEKKQYITWQDFDNYIYSDQSTKDVRKHLYTISGTSYSVMVMGPKSDEIYPDSITFHDAGSTMSYIDLTVDNLSEFLAGISKTPTKYIKAQEVLDMCDKAVFIQWSDFAEYKFTEKTEAAEDQSALFVVRMYQLDDADYSVWVYGEKVVGRPQKIILVDNNNHKNFVDLSAGKDAEAFINKNILKK